MMFLIPDYREITSNWIVVVYNISATGEWL